MQFASVRHSITMQKNFRMGDVMSLGYLGEKKDRTILSGNYRKPLTVKAETFGVLKFRYFEKSAFQ